MTDIAEWLSERRRRRAAARRGVWESENSTSDAFNTLPALLTAVERVLALHTKSPNARWYGIPRADKSEHYCMADRESWPCSTRRTIEGAINEQ